MEAQWAAAAVRRWGRGRGGDGDGRGGDGERAMGEKVELSMDISVGGE